MEVSKSEVRADFLNPWAVFRPTFQSVLRGGKFFFFFKGPSATKSFARSYGI